jgi:hypothetical protein
VKLELEDEVSHHPQKHEEAEQDQNIHPVDLECEM